MWKQLVPIHALVSVKKPSDFHKIPQRTSLWNIQQAWDLWRSAQWLLFNLKKKKKIKFYLHFRHFLTNLGEIWYRKPPSNVNEHLWELWNLVLQQHSTDRQRQNFAYIFYIVHQISIKPVTEYILKNYWQVASFMKIGMKRHTWISICISNNYCLIGMKYSTRSACFVKISMVKTTLSS